MATETADSFAENYKILVNCVERIRRAEVGDIDQLVGLVQSATEAHKACKTRLTAIEKLLEPLDDGNTGYEDDHGDDLNTDEIGDD